MSLSIQPSDIDLPLRVVSYRERPSSTLRLLREPQPRYDRGKPAADAKVPDKATQPHPFNKDLRWKTLIESLPREFLRFFTPGIAAGMDPAKKIEFLDKELLDIFSEEGKRLAPMRVDKLLKIPMLDGSDVRLHCEVQGSRDSYFPPRMLRYYTSLDSKYPGQVTAIAILTDGNRKFRPGPFRETRGPKKVHQLCYDYAVYKVLDQSEEELERSDDPFTLVILTVKAALMRRKRKYTEEEYFRRKLELVDWLKKRSTTVHQEKTLLAFLKEYGPFTSKTLETKFNEQLKERSEAMGLVETLIAEAEEKGLEKGKLPFVKYLLNNTDHDDEKIADVAGVDVNFVKKVQAELQTRMVVN